MAKQYLMGIDGGTQSTKVIIVDEHGHTIAQASENLQPMHTTADGVAEHPDDDLFDSLISTIKKRWNSLMENQRKFERLD